MRKMWLVIDNSPARPSVPMLILPEPGSVASLAPLLGDPYFAGLDVIIGRSWNGSLLRIVTEKHHDEVPRS